MQNLLPIAFVVALVFVPVAEGGVAAANCVGGSCQIGPAGNGDGNAAGSEAVVRVVNETGRGRNLGSGTLIELGDDRGNAACGFVLTCGHLFEVGSEEVGRITVSFPDGSNFAARLLGFDRQWDLAVLQIARPRAVAVTIASVAPRPGQWLSSCGYGRDGRYWCNRGQARGYVRPEGAESFETLELSGMARQGDSGGPVFNQDRELVAVLWGTNGRIVGGTYCGRIRIFLARVFGALAGNPPPRQQRPEAGNLSPPVPHVQRPVVPIRRDGNGVSESVGLLRRRLDGLETRLQGSELGEKARSVARDVARDAAGRVIEEFLATHNETSVAAWVPGLMTALGWTGPPAIVATLGITVLSRLLRRRVKKRLDEKQRGGGREIESRRQRLNDSYAQQLADVFALSGHSPVADATLGREYDEELRRAEKSSDGALASWARGLRERVAQRFYRIHDGQPMPAEPVGRK